MKQFTMLVAVALAGGWMLSGCGKTQETPSAQPPAAAKPAAATAPADAPQASATMTDLVASAKGAVDKAMALAKDGKYQDALALLQQKAAEVQANPDAKKVIDDAVAQIKKMMADAAAKAAAAKTSDAIGGLAK